MLARSISSVLFLLAVVLSTSFAQDVNLPYKDASLPPEQRAADLVTRMTLEEKVDQLAGGRRRSRTPADAEEKAICDHLAKLYREDAKPSPHDSATFRNRAQRYLLEKTRLGIPTIFMGEALHGFMSYGSTMFPQALGLASTWDPELVQEVFQRGRG